MSAPQSSDKRVWPDAQPKSAEGKDDRYSRGRQARQDRRDAAAERPVTCAVCEEIVPVTETELTSEGHICARCRSTG